MGNRPNGSLKVLNILFCLPRIEKDGCRKLVTSCAIRASSVAYELRNTLPGPNKDVGNLGLPSQAKVCSLPFIKIHPGSLVKSRRYQVGFLFNKLRVKLTYIIKVWQRFAVKQSRKMTTRHKNHSAGGYLCNQSPASLKILNTRAEGVPNICFMFSLEFSSNLRLCVFSSSAGYLPISPNILL